MFEDAMMESGGRINTRSKYYTVFGALLNGCVLAALILVPLLHPQALPKSEMTAMLVAPPPPPPPPTPRPLPQIQPVRAVPMLNEFIAPRTIPARINTGRDTAQPPAATSNMQDMGAAAAPPGSLFDILGSGGQPVVQAPPPQKVRVSQGVMAGNIVSGPKPAYPAIAKQARIQGTVILSATISKSGSIENLSVVSGPAMLAPAAIDAVRQWRYRPYLLNGAPVEVQTLVNVTFTLGASE